MIIIEAVQIRQCHATMRITYRVLRRRSLHVQTPELTRFGVSHICTSRFRFNYCTSVQLGHLVDCGSEITFYERCPIVSFAPVGLITTV